MINLVIDIGNSFTKTAVFNNRKLIDTAVFETIDEAGRLIVRANDNSRIAITAGDVHFGTAASLRS